MLIVKESFYNIPISVDGESVTFNAMSKKYVATSQLKKAISDGENFEIDLLRRSHFIETKHKHDFNYIKVFTELRASNSTGNAFIIIPTNNCNMKCSYCYMSHVSKKKMKKEVALSVISFIKNKTKETVSGQKISLSFYGGEPLLEKETVLFIIDRLSETWKEKFIEPEISITTNGVLLDQDFIEKVMNYTSYLRIQVSMVGSEEVQQEVRAAKSEKLNKEYYRKMVDNLKILSRFKDKIRLFIRVDIDSKVYKNIDSLIEAIKQEGLEKLAKFSFSPVLPNSLLDQIKNPQSILEKKTELAREKAISAGLRVLSPPLERICQLNLLNNVFVIAPDGKHYSCEVDAINNTQSSVIGDLDNDILKDKVEKLFLGLPPKCKKCSFLPLCLGGCAYQRDKYHKIPFTNGIWCKKEEIRSKINEEYDSKNCVTI